MKLLKSVVCTTLLISPLLLGGCATLYGGRTITAAEIRQSGASDAWEILEQNGTEIRIPAQPRDRSAASYIAAIPRVIVDGVQMIELRLLRDIPAGIISRIRIVPSRFGDGEDEILIETRHPR